MIRLLARHIRGSVPLLPTPARFAGSNDWAKDREKAAEKEYAIREEKEKMKKIRSKVQEGKAEVRLENPLEEVDNIEALLKDREYLVVS